MDLIKATSLNPSDKPNKNVPPEPESDKTGAWSIDVSRPALGASSDEGLQHPAASHKQPASAALLFPGRLDPA